jgi:hypothetical protein
MMSGKSDAVGLSFGEVEVFASAVADAAKSSCAEVAEGQGFEASLSKDLLHEVSNSTNNRLIHRRLRFKSFSPFV